MVPLIRRLYTVINTTLLLDLWLVEFQDTEGPSIRRANCNLYSDFQLHPLLLCRSRANCMLMVIQSEKIVYQEKKKYSHLLDVFLN